MTSYERPPLRVSGGYMETAHSLDRIVDRFARALSGQLTYTRTVYADDPDNDTVETVPVIMPEFDTVVATGISGLIALPLFAREAGCNWLAIRKRGDGSHSSLLAEGSLGKRWLFVDDFISSGGTVSRVASTVSRLAIRHGRQTECVGAYLYERVDISPFESANYLHSSYFSRRYVNSDGTIGWTYPGADTPNGAHMVSHLTTAAANPREVVSYA